MLTGPPLFGVLFATTVLGGWLESLPARAADARLSASTAAGPVAREGAFFGLDKVHKFVLRLSPKNWEAMQRTSQAGRSFFGGGPGPSTTTSSADRDSHRTGSIEFPWVQAELSEDGHNYTNVGLRYKGNFTYMFSMGQLKRSLKLEFDHYDKQAPQFHGLRKFNLHAGVMDSTKVREALSYDFFRAAGVAAPRTAFAEVSLSVPGKYEQEYLGLFTLTEQVDKQFLKERFGSDKGLLMKPLVRGPDYFGEKWEAYQDRYRPHRQPSTEEARRLIAFAKLVDQAPEDQFRQAIADYLDVEAFLRFIAVNALVVNLDSPFAMPQNFYLYLHPETQKFIFFPWDLDLSLAAWPMGGPPEQQMNLSLLHPHAGEHRLIDRLLAMPEVKQQYLALLKQMVASSFAKDRLLRQIDVIERATKEPLAHEAKAAQARGEGRRGFGFGGPGMGMGAPDPKTFVEKRTESVLAQLEGKSTGYVPGGMMFGPQRFRPPNTPQRPPNFAPPPPE